MNHPLQCRCGTLKGYVVHSAGVNRCVCYCSDCQAFAHFLGQPSEILDAQGGTDVIQTRPANVTFTQGQSALACMRLTERGLLRWYAACCNTARFRGNVPRSAAGLHCRTQRSNFVDRMIDDVVRSTPSNAPMRSMT
jgi:hypothetical protein